MYDLNYNKRNLSLKDKLWNLSFSYIILITILAIVGTITLYSAANGNWQPWALKHITRFGIAFCLMIMLALVNVQVYYKYAYVFYFLSLILLIAVEIGGHIGMGAQRWVNLGLFKIQPSELMKIGLVLFLARYFNTMTIQGIKSVRGIVIPVIMALLPVALIVLQPDLGTGLMLIFTTGILLFVIGVQWWKFAIVGALGGALLPI